MKRLKTAIRDWLKTISSYYVVRGFPGAGDANWQWWLAHRADPAYANQLADMNLVKVKKVEGVIHFVRAYSEITGRPLKDIRIMDAGCGYGAYACVLASLGCRLTGVDINQELIQTAEKRAAGFGINTLEFVKGDTSDFLAKTAPSSFDIILALDTLEHMENPTQFLEHAHHALVPSGNLILIIPNGLSIIEIIYHPFADWIHGHILRESHPKGAVHIQRFTFTRLKELGSASGFSFREVRHTYASGIFGVLFLCGGFRGRWADLNLQIADSLPTGLAGGWLIQAVRSEAISPRQNSLFRNPR